MISSRSRPIAGILSIILLASCLYLSSNLASQQGRDTPAYLNLVATAIFAFNIPILLSWIAFGIVGGIAVTIFSLLAVVFLDLRMGLYGYHVFTISFAVTGFVGYAFLRAKDALDQSCQLRSEKTEEEINLLTNGLQERNASIQSLEEKLVRYSLLKGVSESLSTALALDDVNNLIIKESSDTIGKSGRVLLFLVDSEKQDLMLAAAKDELRIKTKKGDAFDQWMLRNHKALIIEDVTKDYRFPADNIEEAKPVFRSLIAQPLISENKVIGILRMDSPREFEYTQDDLRLLDILSDLGAVAVQNALLYSRIQELAIRDSLTGLAVRRYFMERFHHEIKRAARKREELSLLMLDIDHFKKYNDTYGHTAGDLVLKHMAKTILGMVDDADVVGRYGGEEIVVLLCGKSKQQAAAEAEKIRALIKEKPFTLRRQEMQLTVSVGVATYPEDAIAEEELIRIADGRLYRAKTGGRDKVCSS
jgi:diguanylate cyclase (GGDEF)-like protein